MKKFFAAVVLVVLACAQFSFGAEEANVPVPDIAPAPVDGVPASGPQGLGEPQVFEGAMQGTDGFGQGQMSQGQGYDSQVYVPGGPKGSAGDGYNYGEPVQNYLPQGEGNAQPYGNSFDMGIEKASYADQDEGSADGERRPNQDGGAGEPAAADGKGAEANQHCLVE